MVKPSIIISTISAATAGLSFLNQVVVASLFGTTQQMDVYLVATSLPLMVSGILCGGLNFALVPLLSAGVSSSSSTGQVRRNVLKATILICVVVSGVGAAAADPVIRTFLGKFPEHVIAEGIWLHRISWLTAAFLIAGAYFVALHNANRRFFLAALSAVIPYAAMLATIVLFGSAIGVRSIALGMLLGSAAAVIILFASASGELGLRGTNRGEENKVVRSFLRNLPFLMTGMLTFAAYPLVDAFWAARLGEGAVSYLGYAQRILIAIGGLVVAGPFAILATKFVETEREGTRRFNEAMLASLSWLLVVLSPTALILAVLGDPIVMILLQRGQFTADSTRYVGTLLLLMSPGMVAMLCGTILFRGFFARNDYRSPALIGVLWTAAYFGLAGTLSTFMGVSGLAVAYSVVWVLTLVLGFRLFLREDFKKLFMWRKAAYVSKLAVSIAITFVTMQEVRDLLMDPSESYAMISLITRAAVTAFIALVVFGLVSWKILKIVPPRST
ncbi:MAG: hypothetical protein EPO20_09715 [Betaproteobacteria bacterium]|nr:MAG: hypothetical protein EPO20_09715 [Betaproteobacteria bacterium]